MSTEGTQRKRAQAGGARCAAGLRRLCAIVILSILMMASGGCASWSDGGQWSRLMRLIEIKDSFGGMGGGKAATRPAEKARTDGQRLP